MANNTMRLGKRLLGTSGILGSVAVLSACGPTAPSPVFNNDARLVFPQTASAITVDGIGPVVGAGGDAAWDTDAFRFDLEQGSTNPAATLRGVATTDDFYVYVDAEDAAYDSSDTFVLTLNPDGASGNYHRFLITPCPSAGSACPGSGGAVAAGIVPTVNYATGVDNAGTVTWTNAAVPAAADLEVRSNVNQAGSTNRWTVEMRISRTALGGFNTNWMGLFANAIVADEPAFETVQYSWPTGLDVADALFGAADSDYPAISQWGSATLSTAFGNGVSTSFHEFGSNQTNPSELALDEPNSFHAYAINNQSTGGTLVQANDVTATFEIMNNGLGAGWTTIPAAGNPTASANIPAAGAHRFETGLWTLSPAEVTDYTAFSHQCVRVTLSTTDPDTVIAQATSQRNMSFVTVNSPFERKNTLSLSGFEESASKENPQFVLRESFVNLPEGFKWETRLEGAKQLSERKWSVDLNRGKDQQLGVWVSPDDRLKVPSRRVKIEPNLDKPVTVGVKAGSVVTLITDGSIKMGDALVSGGGFSSAALEQLKINAKERGKLPEGRPDRYGLVIGSFDDFKTFFAIGNGTTIVVPKGAQQLSMLVNDGENGAQQRGGDGFSVQLIETGMSRSMMSTFAGLGYAAQTGKEVFLAPLGSNLPSWLIRGELVTDRYVTINKKRFRVHKPAGSFGYWIRDTGQTQPLPMRSLTAVPARR